MSNVLCYKKEEKKSRPNVDDDAGSIFQAKGGIPIHKMFLVRALGLEIENRFLFWLGEGTFSF